MTKTNKMEKKTDEQLASKWIAEMTEMGITPDDMIRIIQLVREMHAEIKDDINCKGRHPEETLSYTDKGEMHCGECGKTL